VNSLHNCVCGPRGVPFGIPGEEDVPSKFNKISILVFNGTRHSLLGLHCPLYDSRRDGLQSVPRLPSPSPIPPTLSLFLYTVPEIVTGIVLGALSLCVSFVVTFYPLDPFLRPSLGTHLVPTPDPPLRLSLRPSLGTLPPTSSRPESGSLYLEVFVPP
jgi:hypothetical protein